MERLIYEDLRYDPLTESKTARRVRLRYIAQRSQHQIVSDVRKDLATAGEPRYDLLARLDDLHDELVLLADVYKALPIWRPIETAPLDGSWILGCNVNGAKGRAWNIVWWREEHGDWYTPDLQPSRVTHWMPLPDHL